MSVARALNERPDAYPSRNMTRPVWFPRKEPVLYATRPDSRVLSDEQLASYERDGFIVIEGLFSRQEIAALQEELSNLRAAPAYFDQATLIREPGVDNALRSVFSIHTQSLIFKRLASDRRLVGVARAILDDDVYIHQSRLNYKPGFDGKEFYWHSDFETWHVEDGMPRMRALSMSLLLSDNLPTNGPLMVMPGSHKHFVACVGATPDEHYKQSLRKQEYGVPDRESLARLAEAGGIVAPPGKAGTVIVFDCNIMHGSNGNITPYARSNAFLVYNAVSNALEAPFGAMAPRPGFIAARETPKPLNPIEGPVTQGSR